MKHITSYDQFINEKFLETRYSAGLAIVHDGKIFVSPRVTDQVINSAPGSTF